MIIFETIAALFSLASIYLTAKENKWCWPVGIIGILLYASIFLYSDLIGNFWLQSLFLAQSVLGSWAWKNKNEISWSADHFLIFSLFIISSVIIILILDSISRMPIMDGITTTLSIFGMFLLAYKKIDAWIYWIVADIIFIFMFYQSGLFVSAITYFIFLVLSIIGLIKWHNLMKMKRLQ